MKKHPTSPKEKTSVCDNWRKWAEEGARRVKSEEAGSSPLLITSASCSNYWRGGSVCTGVN